MAYLLFIYNNTDKRNQMFQDFSQNSRIYRTQLQFVNVFFFGHPLDRKSKITTIAIFRKAKSYFLICSENHYWKNLRKFRFFTISHPLIPSMYLKIDFCSWSMQFEMLDSYLNMKHHWLEIYHSFFQICVLFCKYIKRHVYPGTQGTHDKLN